MTSKTYLPYDWSADTKSNDPIIRMLHRAVTRSVISYKKKLQAEGKSILDIETIYKPTDFIEKFFNSMNDYISDKQSEIWKHQIIEMLQKDDDYEHVNYTSLKSLAADYLSIKDHQNNYLDWLLLDALLFMETKFVARRIFSTNFGVSPSPQMSYLFSAGNWPLYFLLKFLFWILSWLVGYGLPIVGAYYLANNEHEYIAIALILFLSISFLSYLFHIPSRRRKHKAFEKILFKRLELYDCIGKEVISPRVIKDKIAEIIESESGALELQSNLDASIIAIVDRIYERDPTAFLVH